MEVHRLGFLLGFVMERDFPALEFECVNRAVCLPRQSRTTSATSTCLISLFDWSTF